MTPLKEHYYSSEIGSGVLGSLRRRDQMNVRQGQTDRDRERTEG